MSRHRTSAQISAAKRNFYSRLVDGAEVIAVRHLADGQTIVYRALVSILPDGRVDLKAIGSYRAKAPFTPAEDKAVPGYPQWFVISGIPVCMSGHYRSVIAFLMQMAPFCD